MWTEGISDKQLKACRILDRCEPGEAIMADKGFFNSDLTSVKGVKLIMIIPPLQTHPFSRREIKETRRKTHLRIGVEQAIE